MHTYRARPDVSVLSDYLEVPGLGFLPGNAFVIHAPQAALEAMLREFQPA
jgi:hypothetical protein